MEDINCWESKFELCKYSSRLLEKIELLNRQVRQKVDIHEVKKAIYYARKYHGSQIRKSGELYYSHPLEVAYIASDYIFRTNIIVTSILHDIVEDTEVTIGVILDNFGWRVAEMVDRLTRDRLDGSKLSVKEILNNAYKNGDKEVLLIKIIDRLHNLQNMHSISVGKQITTAQETLNTVLLACTYLEDINTEFLMGNIINKILDYKANGDLLKSKDNNSLINSTHRDHFIDLFKS